MFRWLRDMFQEGLLMRRMLMLWGIAIVTYTLLWSLDFAQANVDNSNAVLILGAVWFPITGLQAYMFGSYTNSRSN